MRWLLFANMPYYRRDTREFRHLIAHSINAQRYTSRNVNFALQQREIAASLCTCANIRRDETVLLV
jgi:hypothetical protein